MIVCPVCEHVQAAGAECDVCGKRLARASASGGAAPPALEGLEATAFPPARADGVPLDDFDPTRQAAVDVPEGVAVELEPDRAAPLDVDAPAIEGLEPTEADGIPGDGPTPLPFVATCRYCRTPAAPGDRSCARCGMWLPAVDPPAPRLAAGDAERRCGCGALVRGARCPGCGGRAPG